MARSGQQSGREEASEWPEATAYIAVTLLATCSQPSPSQGDAGQQVHLYALDSFFFVSFFAINPKNKILYEQSDCTLVA